MRGDDWFLFFLCYLLWIFVVFFLIKRGILVFGVYGFLLLLKYIGIEFFMI